LGIIRNFRKSKATPYFSQANLWIHSVAVGTAIRSLSEKHGKNINPEDFFTIGILHDIGKLVLDQFFHDLFERVLIEAQSDTNAELHAVERELIGLDHGEIGGLLLSRWQLPDEISNPIAFHHRTDFPGNVDLQAVSMLRIADVIVKELGMGTEENAAPPQILEGDLRFLKLEQEDLAREKEYLESAKERIHAFFAAIN
jgi:putative nucleotidyltransferase with HDIG domain